MGIRARKASGFTMIELVFVIALVLVMYSVALPQLGVRSGTEIASKLGTLAGDLRSAFDLAVLNQMPHRLVFDLKEGTYWLERTSQLDFMMGDEANTQDIAGEAEKELQDEFEEQFKEYEELAGPEIDDVDGKRTVKATSPVLAAKERLSPPKWEKIKDTEWGLRKLDPPLRILSAQCEHHTTKVQAEPEGPAVYAMIYVMPSGYLEPCVVHLTELRQGQTDDSKQPYSLLTRSFEGVAEYRTGLVEYEGLENALDET